MGKFEPIVKKAPYILHGGDYNPEQWLKWKDTIWKEDMRLAKLAGVNTLSVGIFSWALLEPAEGQYNFGWLDEVMDNLAENGITAVLATPSGARPAWMSRKYPEVLRVNDTRQRNVHGERHNHCFTSPVYREKTRAINTALAKRYKNHPALGVWHISNEFSGSCHCPLCQAAFRDFLKDKYKTLDALNDAWWSAFWSSTVYDWNEIESPGRLGNSGHNGLRIDWMRFTTEQTVGFYLNEIAPLKEFTPDVPCTTNLMAGYPGLDYARLAEVMDVISWDSYPRWTGTEDDIEIGLKTSYQHDLMRGLKLKPFMLMESCPSATNWQAVPKLRRPGVHKLQSFQALAHGADTIQYFQYRKGRGGPEQFHGAIAGHGEVENTRVFRDVAEVGEKLKTLNHLVGMDTPSEAALIYDYNVRWAIDETKGFLQDKTDYEGTVVSHYSAFWKRGIPVDVIDSRKPFDKYKLVSAPMLYLLRPGAAEKIADYVKKGGIFVTTYTAGYVDDTGLTFMEGYPGPLKETLGIWTEEIDALFPDERNSIEWNGKSYDALGLCELIHLAGAKALGSYGKDFYAGRPALTVNEYGKGKAYYIAARTGGDFLDSFYDKLTSEAGIKSCFDAPLPEGVTAQVRADGGKKLVFLLNFTPSEKKAGGITLKPFGAEIVG